MEILYLVVEIDLSMYIWSQNDRLDDCYLRSNNVCPIIDFSSLEAVRYEKMEKIHLIEKYELCRLVWFQNNL